MTGDQGVNMLYLVLCMVLVASAFIGMRLQFGKAIKMALAWVAIFGIAFALFTFRGEFSALGARLKAEATGALVETGQEMRITMRDDGHFWVDATINGHSALFLVDSGASITTVSSAVAEAAGLARGLRTATVETANGTVPMAVVTANRFDLGGIHRSDFTLHVNKADNVNVLGMNFLSSIASWKVEGNVLVLNP